MNWSPTVDPFKLETETFTSSTTFDALNRPIQVIAPHSSKEDAKINIIQPGYNEANLLENMEVWLEQTAEPPGLLDPDTATKHAVKNIDYNAKGQRVFIEYGSGASENTKGVNTTYEYDRLTFRLIRLETLRGEEHMQDIFYTYDPASNITTIRDDAQQTIYFDGQVVRPDADYKYDAIYRLIEAHGREHRGQASQPQTTWNDESRVVKQDHPNNGSAMRNYFEFYEYDEVGNIKSFNHKADKGNWVRTYEYNEDSQIKDDVATRKSNRLSRTIVHPSSQQPITEPYTYDAHGSVTSMPHLPNMEWDFKDELQMVDKGGGCKAYYVYDATGQRVRKVIEDDGKRLKERIYLGGFEVYRKYNGNELPKLERETLHIMDDKQRIALVETRTLGEDPAPEQLIRYQFGNHLRSASMELDDKAQIISYEEYYPYGSTSYQAVRNQTEVPDKRYRYTGKERDEETGLYYHGARYYAPWVGRWISCDHTGIADSLDLYAYASGNPVRMVDPSGTQSSSPLQDVYSTQMPLHMALGTRVSFDSEGKATLLPSSSFLSKPSITMPESTSIPDAPPTPNDPNQQEDTDSGPSMMTYIAVYIMGEIPFVDLIGGYGEGVLGLMHAEANSRPDAGVEETELPTGGLPDSPDWEGPGWESGFLADPAGRAVAGMVGDSIAWGIIGELALARGGLSSNAAGKGAAVRSHEVAHPTPQQAANWESKLPEAKKRVAAAKLKYGGEGAVNMAKGSPPAAELNEGEGLNPDKSVRRVGGKQGLSRGTQSLRDANKPIYRVYRDLQLTDDERTKLHSLVHGSNLGYKGILDEALKEWPQYAYRVGR